MPENAAVRSAALTLIAQYGDDAEVIAVLRAAEIAAEGDQAGLDHWDAVIAVIQAMSQSGVAPQSLN